MTRKLVVVNMSNYGDEAFEIEDIENRTVTKTPIRPGEYAVCTGLNNLYINVVRLGQSRGYAPPVFPRKVIDLFEERAVHGVQPSLSDSEKIDKILDTVRKLDPDRPKSSPPVYPFV